MGGNDIEEEAAWKWIDCTPWEVEFWQQGEPNNEGRNANCLNHLVKETGMVWFDYYCGGKLTFVCSKQICTGKNEIY